MYKNRKRFPLWNGDLIEGNHSLKSIENKEVNIVTYPEEDDVLDIDSLTYGEKKCLFAFYNLNDEHIDKIILYKIDDLWEAFYEINEELEVLAVSPHLFEVCGSIIYGNGNPEIEKRFIDILSDNISDKTLNITLEKIKKKYNNKDNMGKKL